MGCCNKVKSLVSTSWTSTLKVEQNKVGRINVELRRTILTLILIGRKSYVEYNYVESHYVENSSHYVEFFRHNDSYNFVENFRVIMSNTIMSKSQGLRLGLGLGLGLKLGLWLGLGLGLGFNFRARVAPSVIM